MKSFKNPFFGFHSKINRIFCPICEEIISKIPLTPLLCQPGNSLMSKLWKPTQSPMRT